MKYYAAKNQLREVVRTTTPAPQPETPVMVQPKLMVGEADSMWEREADRMAETIGRQTTFTSSPGWSAAQHPGMGMMANERLAGEISSTRGRGEALPAPTRSFMESRFGQNLAGVNIHTGDYAVQMNRQLQSRAFTTGNDIYFNQGQYQPESHSGKQLLAHELTHTLQQGGGGPQPGLVQRDGEEESSGTDFQFDLLPPHLQLMLPHFLLDANTSRVRAAFTWDQFRSTLDYNYGGSLDLGLRYRMFSTQVGFNPSTSVLNLGANLTLPNFRLGGSYSPTEGSGSLSASGSYRGFNVGGSYNFGTRAVGLNFGYGAPLLPSPAEMSGTFGAAGSAISPLVGSIPGVMPDPMAWYQAQQAQIQAVTEGVSLFNRLREEPSSGLRFGAGARLSYNPESGLFVFAGVQGSF